MPCGQVFRIGQAVKALIAETSQTWFLDVEMDAVKKSASACINQVNSRAVPEALETRCKQRRERKINMTDREKPRKEVSLQGEIGGAFSVQEIETLCSEICRSRRVPTGLGHGG
jgi:hypothetical protein